MTAAAAPLETAVPADAAAVLIDMIESGVWASGQLPGGGTVTELLQQWVKLLNGTANVRNMKREMQVLYILALVQRALQAQATTTGP